MSSVFKSPEEAYKMISKRYGKRMEYDKMSNKDNYYMAVIHGKYYRPIEVSTRMEKYGDVRYTFEIDCDPRNVIEESPANSCFFKNVIFNPPATIVFWTDGTKTVVKTQKGEKFDPEKGIAMAIAKKAMGNKGSYFNDIKKWANKYEEKKDTATLSMKKPVKFEFTNVSVDRETLNKILNGGDKNNLKFHFTVNESAPEEPSDDPWVFN